jgi:hypothetical protein
MGSVAQLHDPEGDRLVLLAKNIGEENLSEGERWRLQNTLDRRRMLEAKANAPGGRTDALDAEANERRFAALEAHMQWASGMLEGLVWPVVGEVIAEAEERAAAEAKKLQDELRMETDQKLNAQFAGFETAVSELRGEDRAAMLATVRETLGDAESRIDEHLEQALEKTWERCELEVALVRDELMNVISEKKFGVFTDEAPKLELAEKAIAALRQRTTALEAEGARANQLAGVANQLAALEDAYRESTKKLTVRCATAAVLLRKETARADELAGKVAALEAALEQLTAELFKQKVIK